MYSSLYRREQTPKPRLATTGLHGRSDGCREDKKLVFQAYWKAIVWTHVCSHTRLPIPPDHRVESGERPRKQGQAIARISQAIAWKRMCDRMEENVRSPDHNAQSRARWLLSRFVFKLCSWALFYFIPNYWHWNLILESSYLDFLPSWSCHHLGAL